MAQNLLTPRRVEMIPQMPNPLDKSTIFSIFPQTITERKITVFPSVFELKAGTPENPSALVIGSSSWWKDIFEANQAIEIPISSLQMADSICKDYYNSMFGFSPNAHIGLFWLPGEVSVAQLKKDYRQVLDAAIAKQKNWYLFLLNAADAMWARSNGNPNVISDHMRIAAKELGKNDKEWLRNSAVLELVRCVGCGNMKSPEYPVCPTCKTVTDPKKFSELGLKTAG